MTAAPLVDVDDLDGAVPTWRLHIEDEPIYLKLVAELGKPGSLLGPAPSVVVAGELADPDDVDVEDDEDDVEDERPRGEAPPTMPIPIRAPAATRTPRKRRQPTQKRTAS